MAISDPKTRDAKISSIRTKHWQDFLRWVDARSDSRWVFRGLGDNSFGLIPSAGRVANYDVVHERAVFSLFLSRAPEFGLNAGLTKLDLLAIAQHHGVPTRLQP